MECIRQTNEIKIESKAVKTSKLAERIYGNGKMIAIAKMQGHSNRVEELDQFKDMFKSSSMSFTIAPEINGEPKTEQGQNASITFVNTVLPDTPPMTGTLKQRSYTFIVMAPYSLKEKLALSDASLDIMVKGMTFQSTNSSQATVKMETMIQAAGITDEYNLLNMDKMLDQNRNMIFIANVFGYTFIIMISLIAVAMCSTRFPRISSCVGGSLPCFAL